MDWQETIVILCFIILIIIIGVYIQKYYDKDFTKHCDNKYGKDNWILDEITGEKGFYIGQMWGCINKTNQTRD